MLYFLYFLWIELFAFSQTKLIFQNYSSKCARAAPSRFNCPWSTRANSPVTCSKTRFNNTLKITNRPLFFSDLLNFNSQVTVWTSNENNIKTLMKRNVPEMRRGNIEAFPRTIYETEKTEKIPDTVERAIPAKHFAIMPERNETKIVSIPETCYKIHPF